MNLPNSLVDFLTHGGKKRLHVHPITNGLIHQTYRIDIDEECSLLQSINTSVFSEPSGLIQNHRALYHHFSTPDSPFNHPLAKPLPFDQDQWLFTDETGQPWRRCAFIANTHTKANIESPEQAEALAEFFARFTRHASTIGQTSWHVPLPGFHNLRMRFDQFEQAIRSDLAGRKKDRRELIEALTTRIRYVEFFDRMTKSNLHPLRMMHHDAKLSNVLIDARTEEWCCPIDLDTVMPGYFFSDIGDMVRSICNGASDEDSTELETPFGSELYEALLQGYRKGMQGVLTEAEQMQLDLAGVLMTYMQTMRFLTDHLNGDLYYRTAYPGQNLLRAQNQFRLLEQMETYLGDRLFRALHA